MVHSVSSLDSSQLAGSHSEFIRILLRGLELPNESYGFEELNQIVMGGIVPSSVTPLSEADVHESLAALKRSCNSKAELRYQLAAAVVVSAWIEDERRLGFSERKKFYAFKQKVDSLAVWAMAAQLPGVALW